MNSLISTPPPNPPHHLHDSSRRSPSRSFLLANPMMMNNRKRKADDDENDDRMSASPSASPSMSSRTLVIPSNRTNKRSRPNISGRPLALSRLLETLDARSLRTVLQSICERHPEIGTEVVSTAPRPSVSAALDVLHNYEANLQGSFPVGGTTSDYAYNRVRQALVELLKALDDFTPHFLPPNETQASTSLAFLDGATEVIHRLPNWDNPANNHHKHLAYEEISKAWSLVVREAAKKGGGIQLQYGSWDEKVAKHNLQAGGRMQGAADELRTQLGWMNSHAGDEGSGGFGSIREQLLSGTYGSNLPVQVGPW